MKALMIVVLCLFTLRAEKLADFYPLTSFPDFTYHAELSTELESSEEMPIDLGVLIDKELNEKPVVWEDPLWRNPDLILGEGTNKSWDDLIALERHVQNSRTTLFASVVASNIYSSYSTGVAYEERVNSKFNWGVSIEREQLHWKNKNNSYYPRGKEELYYNELWMDWFPADNVRMSLMLGGYVRD